MIRKVGGEGKFHETPKRPAPSRAMVMCAEMVSKMATNILVGVQRKPGKMGERKVKQDGSPKSRRLEKLASLILKRLNRS